uniref:C3H1-type domain-containing protein n=1 Tax=Chromera velia CCMP2878 TaxID=1169474 RepID=A0A0G4FSZ1_9ALVE|eukprot:Cvel_18487.t1-p1 / transcript=Cvel_18487.t1 / gene=Cvel_18487 / organism=Chromera_velia_CCMP2878 / gene_product=hypothetical protein / transcript_product=hypothetical protein / location=Cvel_scaffold1533:39823-42494(-) / protein_length=524 / sequence_SO=supercontig / SO=protein_coding / is_pseudo=false
MELTNPIFRNAIAKTKICGHHERGYCRLGSRCRFAHEEELLRYRNRAKMMYEGAEKDPVLQLTNSQAQQTNSHPHPPSRFLAESTYNQSSSQKPIPHSCREMGGPTRIHETDWQQKSNESHGASSRQFSGGATNCSSPLDLPPPSGSGTHGGADPEPQDPLSFMRSIWEDSTESGSPLSSVPARDRASFDRASLARRPSTLLSHSSTLVHQRHSTPPPPYDHYPLEEPPSNKSMGPPPGFSERRPTDFPPPSSHKGTERGYEQHLPPEDCRDFTRDRERGQEALHRGRGTAPTPLASSRGGGLTGREGEGSVNCTSSQFESVIGGILGEAGAGDRREIEITPQMVARISVAVIEQLSAQKDPEDVVRTVAASFGAQTDKLPPHAASQEKAPPCSREKERENPKAEDRLPILQTAPMLPCTDHRHQRQPMGGSGFPAAGVHTEEGSGDFNATAEVHQKNQYAERENSGDVSKALQPHTATMRRAQPQVPPPEFPPYNNHTTCTGTGERRGYPTAEPPSMPPAGWF